MGRRILNNGAQSEREILKNIYDAALKIKAVMPESDPNATRELGLSLAKALRKKEVEQAKILYPNISRFFASFKLEYATYAPLTNASNYAGNPALVDRAQRVADKILDVAKDFPEMFASSGSLRQETRSHAPEIPERPSNRNKIAESRWNAPQFRDLNNLFSEQKPLP